jgi:hypothetical protein
MLWQNEPQGRNKMTRPIAKKRLREAAKRATKKSRG